MSYELLGCGWHGHALVGTDAAAVRQEDDLVVREQAGLRWHRCLRCDAWLPRPVPASPGRPFPPERAEITLPLRGRELRERYVLRLIAVDRVIHCVVLAALAAAVFVFAADHAMLQEDFVRIVTALQASVGGPSATTTGGVEGELTKLFAISLRNLQITGVVLTALRGPRGHGGRRAVAGQTVGGIPHVRRHGAAPAARDLRDRAPADRAEGRHAGHQPGGRPLPGVGETAVRPARRRASAARPAPGRLRMAGPRTRDSAAQG